MALCWLFVQSFAHVWQRASLFTRAGSLTFTTILALVPVMVAIAAILSVLPIATSLQLSVQNFLFSHFVASASQAVQAYLAFFVARAWQLSWLSLSFLVLNALGLLYSIERSLNEIWHVSARTWYRAIGLYLSIFCIIPALLSMSMALSLLMTHATWLSALALPFTRITLLWPLLVSFIAYSFMFKVIPNTHVTWLTAALSALVSALLFEGVKHIFTWYVLAFPSYERIYGAVAAVPLFFLWLYCCWLILFVGAVTGFVWQQRKRGAR